MTATTAVTPEQHLTVVKHLAAGKALDVVAAIMKLDRSVVLNIGSKHGYPSTAKLEWAVDVLTKNLEEARTPTEDPSRDSRARAATRLDDDARPAAPAPQPLRSTANEPLTKPDELRVLLNTGKQHPSKRIQNATNRAFDAIDKLRALINEDQEKHAAKRAEQEAKAKQRGEVERLERELADAKAKLRAATASQSAGGPATAGNSENAAIRQWARDTGVECPDRGRIPGRVRDAYAESHQAGDDAA